jgi:hypothetical protein
LEAVADEGAAGPVINKVAEDVLRRFPGVTNANVRGVMAGFGCLADLVDAPLPRSARCSAADTVSSLKFLSFVQPCHSWSIHVLLHCCNATVMHVSAG